MAKLSEASTSPKPLGSKLPLSNRSILWIDDNPLNNLYEQNLFKQLGADITLATSTAMASSLQALDKMHIIISVSDPYMVENGNEYTKCPATAMIRLADGRIALVGNPQNEVGGVPRDPLYLALFDGTTESGAISICRKTRIIWKACL